MGGLCGCCADDLPETNTMQDNKMMEDLMVMEDESGKLNLLAVAVIFRLTYYLFVILERQSFIQEDVAEFDLTSTGEMVLPTYPLKDVFAAELKKQIKDGRFSVKRNTKAKENVNNLLSDHFKK